MNSSSLIAFAKKKHHHLTSFQDGSNDYPILFSGQIQNKSKKNIYKVGHDLKIKDHSLFENKKPVENEELLVAKSLNIGYYLITPLLIGVFLGYWLDGVFNTKPVLLLTFFLLGIIGSFFNLWKTVQEMK